jgi:hypothetical protein
MKWSKINLEHELIQTRDNASTKLIQQAHFLLEKEQKEEARILELLGISKDNSISFDQLDHSQLDQSKLFSLESIEKLAIRFRLRFLPSSYYTGSYPIEAISRIKELEKNHQTGLQNMFILAPKKKFDLGDCDGDPLLFTRIGENQYYLIASWGNDLHPLRSLILWPFRSFNSSLITSLILSIFFSLIIPARWMEFMNITEVWAIRGMVFIHFLIGFIAIGTLFMFMFFRNFSDKEWNSKYFNG